MPTVRSALYWTAFTVSLVGACVGAFQHAFRTRDTLAPLTPGGTDARTGEVVPAVAFWGGGGLASTSVGAVVVHVFGLVTGSELVRRAAVAGTAGMFASFALLWATRGVAQAGATAELAQSMARTNVGMAVFFGAAALVSVNPARGGGGSGTKSKSL